MRIVTVLWLGFVTAISMMPLRLKYRAGTTGALHGPGHLLIFFVTALLLCRPAARRLIRWLLVCAFAVSMETLEWAAYHNRFEWRDVLLDVLGAALGLAVLSVLVPLTPRDSRSVDRQNV